VIDGAAAVAAMRHRRCDVSVIRGESVDAGPARWAAPSLFVRDPAAPQRGSAKIWYAPKEVAETI